MDASERMRGYLAKIATGPHLSKDLSRDEVRDGMGLVLAGEVSDVRAAVFLIALRMKRETVEENEGALLALRDAVRAGAADVDDLVDLADPYDGFARHLPVSPVLPAVLAACGVSAVSHGCDQMPPKRGVTPARVLAAAGIDVAADAVAAAARVADPTIGWSYVGVEQYCPTLWALVGLREQIVKRPLLATLEKLLSPVRARRNHLVVGYVHKGYEDLLAGLARFAGYTSALVVKGIEGGVVPSTSAAISTRGFTPDGVELHGRLDPADVDVATEHRAPPVPDGADLARAAADAGLAALDGAPGPTRDSLVHAASAILAHVGTAPDRREAAARVRAVLDDGSARARFR